MLLLFLSGTFACNTCSTNEVAAGLFAPMCIDVILLVLLISAVSCRACAAASAAQSTLQGAVDADVEDLSARIASAEAAVREAEGGAERAIEMEQKAARAAAMAQSHCNDAAACQSASDRVRRCTLAV